MKILYGAPASVFVRKPRIILNEKGIDFHCEPINPMLAHGKNISFFVSKNGISLAPFYDLVNIKMYPEFEHEMAMALGDEFDGDMVNAYQLADFADTCGLSRRFVSRQLKSLISKCQKALDFNVEQIAKNQDEKKYLKKYTKIVNARCEHLIGELGYIANIEL